MSQSQLVEFIERVKSDEGLRQRVLHAEREAAARTEQVKRDMSAAKGSNWESLAQIAEEHGYDISIDIERPVEVVSPSERELSNVICMLTCCWVATSVWDGEGIPTVDGPGCGPGTTEFCPF